MKSHAQAGQDTFVFETSGRKTDGIFIDIGCNDPIVHSNTYLLEEFGWRGLLIDIIPCAGGRKSPFMIWDVSVNCNPIIGFWESKNFVDYLSLDVDDATESAFDNLPLERLLAGVITIEHDRYRRGDAFRNKARARLSDCGYDLRAPDVVAPGYGEYEDWFVLSGYPK